MKRLLFCSEMLACPNFHGGCVYPYRVLETLSRQGTHIDYLWLGSLSTKKPVFRVPFRPPFARKLISAGAIAAAGFYIRKPGDYSAEQAIRQAVAKHRPDAVLLDFLWQAETLKDLPCQTLILTHELIHKRVQSYQAAGQDLDFKPLAQEDEIKLLSLADTLIAIQEEDAAWMSANVPGTKVVTIPYPATPRPLAPAPATPPSAMFIGGNTGHNRGAVDWFLSKVWPAVLEHVPEAVFRIYGTVSTPKMQSKHPGVEVCGPVEEVDQAYQQNQVAVVPLQYGSGLKIKLIEAMSLGRPLIATSIGAEGFVELKSGSVFPVADHPATFAQALVRLFRSAEEQAALAQRQLDWCKAIEGRYAPIEL